MKLLYKNKLLKRSFATDKGLAKRYGTLAKKIKQRRIQLESADNLAVISKFPVLRLHKHIGKKGIWSIAINENWRILFEINQYPIPTLEECRVDLEVITIIKIKSV